MRDWREGVSESRGRMGERYTPELCMRGRGKTKKEPVDVEGGQRTSSSGIEVRKGEREVRIRNDCEYSPHLVPPFQYGPYSSVEQKSI